MVRVQSVTWVGVLISPSPLIPLPSRERGILSVGLSCCHPTLHLWIADQVRNDGGGASMRVPRPMDTAFQYDGRHTL